MFKTNNWTLCLAPMVGITNRHFRYFYRMLAPKMRVYTEMVSTNSIIYGNRSFHLDFDKLEHPIALQVGGNDPKSLAYSVRLAKKWNYDEVNLNCGCPSEKVQKGLFGVKLMENVDLVINCIKSMQDASDITITVKHRLGIDYEKNYGFVNDFVEKLYNIGCRVFIVHARNAMLNGFSCKKNRSAPSLKYEFVHQLKKDFPEATIVLNGGLSNESQIFENLSKVDGVMLGRAAWKDPFLISNLSEKIWPKLTKLSQESFLKEIISYIFFQNFNGIPLRLLARSINGFAKGKPGARSWRKKISDPNISIYELSSIVEKFFNS